MAKSQLLVLADVQQRHPEIPSTIFQWSRRNFYLYMVHQSNQCGKHWSTLFWLYKTVRKEPIYLLRFQPYTLSIKSLLNLIAQSVASLTWPDHVSLLQFNQRFSSHHRVITISDINREINKPQRLAWKPYDRVLLQRWSRVLQSCRKVSPLVIGQKNS